MHNIVLKCLLCLSRFISRFQSKIDTRHLRAHFIYFEGTFYSKLAACFVSSYFRRAFIYFILYYFK